MSIIKLLKRNNSFLTENDLEIHRTTEDYTLDLQKFQKDENIISYIIEINNYSEVVLRIEINKIDSQKWALKYSTTDVQQEIGIKNGIASHIIEEIKNLELDPISIKKLMTHLEELLTTNKMSIKSFSNTMSPVEFSNSVEISKNDWKEFRAFLHGECNVPRLRRVLGSDKKYEEFMAINFAAMIDADPENAKKTKNFSAADIDTRNGEEISKAGDAASGIVEILESIPKAIQNVRLIARMCKAGFEPSMDYIKLQLENTSWRDVCYAFGRYKTLKDSGKYYNKVNKIRDSKEEKKNH